MSKKSLSERDVCSKFITPALAAAGGAPYKQIGFTKGIKTYGLKLWLAVVLITLPPSLSYSRDRYSDEEDRSREREHAQLQVTAAIALQDSCRAYVHVMSVRGEGGLMAKIKLSLPEVMSAGYCQGVINQFANNPGCFKPHSLVSHDYQVLAQRIISPPERIKYPQDIGIYETKIRYYSDQVLLAWALCNE